MESTTRNIFEQVLEKHVPELMGSINLTHVLNTVSDLMDLSDTGYREEVIKIFTDVISHQALISKPAPRTFYTSAGALIGKEAYGVGFLAEKHPDIGFVPEMENYIGVKGVVTNYYPQMDMVELTFYGNITWKYPAELILRQFV